MDAINPKQDKSTGKIIAKEIMIPMIRNVFLNARHV